MKKLKVTLRRSVIGCDDRQRATVRGLGLTRTNASAVLENTPAVRGMVKQVLHLVSVHEVEVDG
jgi:large subunit ribosomal protein L30